MPASAADCTEQAFAFIEGLDHLETAKHVNNAMMHSLAFFSIEHFLVTGLSNYRERFEQGVMLRKWPAGWFEFYARKDYVRADSVIRHCRQTVQPFECTEAPYDPERDHGAREVMERAADFGMRRGFSLPVHGLRGHTTCFPMSGAHPGFCQQAKPTLHLTAMYAFERIRQIVHLDGGADSNPLTERKQEVLGWAAATPARRVRDHGRSGDCHPHLHRPNQRQAQAVHLELIRRRHPHQRRMLLPKNF